jgi:hypothetical protein
MEERACTFSVLDPHRPTRWSSTAYSGVDSVVSTHSWQTGQIATVQSVIEKEVLRRPVEVRRGDHVELDLAGSGNREVDRPGGTRRAQRASPATYPATRTVSLTALSGVEHRVRGRDADAVDAWYETSSASLAGGYCYGGE